MTKFNVITIGSALKDTMFYSPEVRVISNPDDDPERERLMTVEYGAKIEVEESFVTYGGGAMNVAVGLNNFGLKVAPLINIGTDAIGQEILAFLKKNKIATDLVSLDRKHSTGFSCIVTAAKDHEHTIFTYKGSSRYLSLPATKKLSADWFYIAALSVNNWETELAPLFALIQKSKGKQKIMWNPGSRQLAEYKKLVKFLPSVEVLLVNRDEAVELLFNHLGKKFDGGRAHNLEYLLVNLKKLGPNQVVITDGANGAFGLRADGKPFYVPAKAKKVMDTVGAGDSFGSGFLAALIETNDFKKALQYGILNSAANLTQIGAQTGLLKGKIK